MIKQKVLESTLIWTEPSTQVSGRKISSMDKELKHGQMEPCMKENMYLAKNMEEANLSGQMGQFM